MAHLGMESYACLKSKAGQLAVSTRLGIELPFKGLCTGVVPHESCDMTAAIIMTYGGFLGGFDHH